MGTLGGATGAIFSELLAAPTQNQPSAAATAREGSSGLCLDPGSLMSPAVPTLMALLCPLPYWSLTDHSCPMYRKGTEGLLYRGH